VALLREDPLQRRDLIKGIGVAGGLAALEWRPLVAAAAEGTARVAGAVYTTFTFQVGDENGIAGRASC
jgi:hypothetical protein